MSESAGLTLLAVQIKALTSFDADNTSICKWGILNSGRNDHYVIIRPGPAAITGLTFATKDRTYRTIVEVWQRYIDDGSSVTDLLGYCEQIVNRIDEYRKLADTTAALRDANVIEMGEVTEQWRNNADGPAWLKRDLIVEWHEEAEVDYAE